MKCKFLMKSENGAKERGFFLKVRIYKPDFS